MGSAEMALRVVVPSAGQTTDELTLVKWLVEPGQQVKRGDPLAEIETDKATMDLECFADGYVLELLVEEGDAVETGQTILTLAESEEELKAGPKAEMPQQRDEPGTQEQAGPVTTKAGKPESRQVERSSGPVRASPAARRLARERGIDLTAVVGTGPGGTITPSDVEKAVAQEPGVERDVKERVVPISRMRRTIGKRLQESAREAPHYYMAMDVDMARALEMRTSVNAANPDTKVSVNDMIVHALAVTLSEYPQLNCRVEDDAIHYLDEINIGIAVATEEGLLVPVIEHADKLDLVQIAKRSRHLAERARAGKIPGGAQGTFTVSNLGMFGVKFFTAIINPPEVAILAVGAIEERPVCTPEGIRAAPMLTLTLSCDHRIVDGRSAAQFLAAVKQRLESANLT
jgi:pyruvate dehydrogenase E2 component (dihydrolipoamide acetyltransferase)